MIRRGACLLLFGAAACGIRAQQQVPPELRDLIEQRIEAVAELLGDDNGMDLTVLSDLWLAHLNDPIDLNHTDAEELAALYLLNDAQVAAILAHRQRFGPYLSVYELQTIDELDLRTLELIRPFVTVHGLDNATHASPKEMLRNGRHEVLLRTQINIEQRKGFLGGGDPFDVPYVDPDGDPLPDVDDADVLDSLRRNNRAYLGSPWKAYARYRFRYRQNISFGITAEKDEGEQFFRGTQPDGFDFYSAHLFLRNVGPVKALALGDYQAQFGQGLVFWSGLAFANKSAYTLNVKRTAPGLMPYASVNENRFMRGAAATLGIARHLEATAFFSRKRIDGTVPDPDAPVAENTDPQTTFSSFLDDGYHRTYRELEKKDAIDELIVGGHLRYKRPTWSVGATAAQVRFGSTLVRDTKPYNRFEFQGKENTTYGVDWNVLHRNLTWFGEGARSRNGGMAGLTGVLIALDKRLSLALLYRDYQRDFQGLYSVAFAEGTDPWNERGLYSGVEIKASRAWTINAYMDQFRFPWLRFQTNGPSSGSDVLGQVTWTPSKAVQVYARARHQRRQRNTEADVPGVDPLVPVEQTNYRFNASYRVSEAVTLRTRIEGVDHRRGGSPREHGFLMYQDVAHRPVQSKVEVTGRIAVFATDSYDARLYAFENDLPGLYSIPPYYGSGMRWYAMLRYTPARHLDVWVRYGAWVYNGQDRISSGLQEIAGDRRSDLKVQLRLQF